MVLSYSDANDMLPGLYIHMIQTTFITWFSIKWKNAAESKTDELSNKTFLDDIADDNMWCYMSWNNSYDRFILYDLNSVDSSI